MGNQKIIELRGVEFINKGAELMLFSILKELRNHFKNPVIVMEKGNRTPRRLLLENNIYTKLNFQQFKINWAKYGSLIPFSIRRSRKFILPDEIDIILDASGFAYGDQWGANYAHKRLGKFIRQWNKEGKQIILLPQAFGPFNDSEMRKAMEEIIDNSHAIFAREERSYSYLISIKNSPKISISNDFTNLIEGKDNGSALEGSKPVAIIPNYKMLEHGESTDDYCNFLLNCISECRINNLNPFFLIHEGKKDLEIANRTNEMLDDKISILDPQDALVIKGIISKCYFIVSSRFHGVVSALSQGIPCIITTWSHKYFEVAKEYNFTQFIMDDLGDEAKLKNLINTLSVEENVKNAKINLLENSQNLKIKSKEMWKKIFEIID